MATSDFVLELCHHVGHVPLWTPGTTVVILHPAPGQVAIGWERPITSEAVEILCVRRSDNGAWTPVIGIADPGEEPTIAVVREALEEADVRTEVRRLLFVEVVGPATYYNGDVTTYPDVVLVAQWVSDELSSADGENSETTFSRGNRPSPMKDRFRRAVVKVLSARPDADSLTA